MSLKTQPAAVLSFGAFQVDLRAGELRKQVKRVKLQEQPLLVLKVLLGRPGEIVTRDELRSQIWSADTFVDFDNSLNTAINKLREALGDSADNPRFIETLPRRGYRFLAPVTRDQRKKRPMLAPNSWAAGAVVAVLVGAVAGGLLWRSLHRPVLSDKDTIVLGDFANSTGDPVFDGTLRQGLSVQLEQSPFLSSCPRRESIRRCA
jgi:DNA-binding winged helix-turn-helix (wHTH) protein